MSAHHIYVVHLKLLKCYKSVICQLKNKVDLFCVNMEKSLQDIIMWKAESRAYITQFLCLKIKI